MTRKYWYVAWLAGAEREHVPKEPAAGRKRSVINLSVLKEIGDGTMVLQFYFIEDKKRQQLHALKC